MRLPRALVSRYAFKQAAGRGHFLVEFWQQGFGDGHEESAMEGGILA
jgi:hypothetical protein